jgi:hypothetical protein
MKIPYLFDDRGIGWRSRKTATPSRCFASQVTKVSRNPHGPPQVTFFVKADPTRGAWLEAPRSPASVASVCWGAYWEQLKLAVENGRTKIERCSTGTLLTLDPLGRAEALIGVLENVDVARHRNTRDERDREPS